jgi:tetratricopeptide (TPR) repeat protein
MNRQYDNYGRDQVNIENLHFTQLITGQELLNRGIQLLSQRNYKQAVSILNDAIKTDPLLSDTYYYLAIALLSGKKPRKVDEWTIRDIEEKLNVAIHREVNPSRYYMLWAIVKYGFYNMNGFIDKPPTSNQLFSLGESIQEKDADEILYYLHDPSNPYWLYLKNKFKKSH